MRDRDRDRDREAVFFGYYNTQLPISKKNMIDHFITQEKRDRIIIRKS